MSDSEHDHSIIGWAVDIVSSYVSNNSVPASAVPGLIGAVHASLAKMAVQPEEQAKQPLQPPVSIKKSVSDDFIVCLEDGKRFKSLKRHLQTVHGMTPEQYRERWSLARDYPMVAPAYAKARSALAKGMGLGASRRNAASLEDEIAVEADTAPIEPEAEVEEQDAAPVEEIAAAPAPTEEPVAEEAPKKAPRAPRKKKAEA